MKHCISVFLLVMALPAAAQFKVVGYLPTWSGAYPSFLATAQFDKLTHLNIAFANPDANGTLVPANGSNADVLAAVQNGHLFNLKVILSIGGGGADGTHYHDLLATDPQPFVDSIVSYVLQYGLDGIDVDIEGDILDGTTLTAAQYETFVTQLGAALHAENKLMTSALATWFAGFVTETAASRFDWINVMSYDATGPWDTQNPGQHTPYAMAVSDFTFWNTDKNVPAEKLTVGVPFYGYGFGTYANQGISFCDIVATYPGSENNDQVGTGGDAIYYNGIPTISQKTQFALQNAAGIMIWELSQDCVGEPALLSAIDSTITAYGTSGMAESSDVSGAVWPNPARATFSFTAPASATFRLLTIAGTDVTAKTVQTVSAGTVTIGTGELPGGIYLLETQSAKARSVRRIVLQR